MKHKKMQKRLANRQSWWMNQSESYKRATTKDIDMKKVQAIVTGAPYVADKVYETKTTSQCCPGGRHGSDHSAHCGVCSWKYYWVI